MLTCVVSIILTDLQFFFKANRNNSRRQSISDLSPVKVFKVVHFKLYAVEISEQPEERLGATVHTLPF